MEEENKYYYGQGLRSDFIEGVKDLGSDSIDYAKENPGQSTGSGAIGVSILGNLLKNKGITNWVPGKFINSAAERQFVKKGTASLTNPKYLKFLGQAGGKIATSRGSIPLLASLVATDAVKAKEGEALAEMSDIDRYQRNQEQAGIDRAQDQAMTMRKYNIIEEQRAARENRVPYGYDPNFPEDGANINVTNFRNYLAQVPEDYRGPEELDFSLIDLSGQSEFPYYKDQSLNTGIDFSKFSQGEQPVTQPNFSAIQAEDQTRQPNLLTSSNPDFRPEEGTPTAPTAPSMLGFRPQFEGQTLGQYLRYEDTPEQATMQRLDPQGRLRQFTSDGQLAPQYSAYEAESQRVQDKLKNQPKRVGSASEVGTGDTAEGDLSLSDYRSILRAQGIGGSAQIALAKQMMTEAESKKSTAELNAEKIRAYIAQSTQPKEPRAPTSAELGLQVGQAMAGLQAKIDAGQELSPGELQTYNGLNAYIQMQSQFGDSPFQMPENPKVLPSADDPEGEKLITDVMSRNPGKSREDVIDKLRSSNKLI